MFTTSANKTSELLNGARGTNECSNLKRLLSQQQQQQQQSSVVIADAKVELVVAEQTAHLEQLLLDSSFDRKLVKIEISTASTTNNKQSEQLPPLQTCASPKKPTQVKRKTPSIKSLDSKQQSSLVDIKSSIDAVAQAALNPSMDTSKAQSAVAETKPKLCNKRKTTSCGVVVVPAVANLKARASVSKLELVEKSIVEQKQQQHHQQQQQQHVAEKLPPVKAKKLKTIADIVKHNSMTNTRYFQQQQSVSSSTTSSSADSTSSSSSNSSNFLNNTANASNIFQEYSAASLISNSDSAANNLTVSWINSNNNNILLNNAQLDTFYTNNETNNNSNNNSASNHNNMSSTAEMVNDSDINIDHLLEIELTANQQSPIDKYIDLDEIDVNPLDCYRNTANSSNNINSNGNNTNSNTNTNTSSNVNGLQNASNTHLDEFNLQFSVCSSSSSGFSEPSSFSCSSSMSSTNNGELAQKIAFYTELQSSFYMDYI